MLFIHNHYVTLIHGYTNHETIGTRPEEVEIVLGGASPSLLRPPTLTNRRRTAGKS
ncbi:hypothetical protein ElyMa_000338600, partial [Elysia marginata]